jgi:uncharacterized protein DUF5947
MRTATSDNPLAALRRIAREREPANSVRCDLCSAGINDPHQHLIEPEQRRLACVCDACAILFGNQGETKYRRVPRSAYFLRDFQLDDDQWRSLQIPIRVAFIFRDSVAQKFIALYPSPAGPTESWLDAAVWAEIAALNPALQQMEPDVEALLINRLGRPDGINEYYIAPIDECFRLTGLLRAHWRGLSGGAKVWEEIANFFLEMRKNSRQ